MIPKHRVSLPMFGGASLATASEHKICNAASLGFAQQRPMGLRVCKLIGLLRCYRSDIHHYGWGGGIPQVLGLARWISTAGDKEEKRLAELYNIMARWERSDSREPKRCTGRCNMCGRKNWALKYGWLNNSYREGQAWDRWTLQTRCTDHTDEMQQSRCERLLCMRPTVQLKPSLQRQWLGWRSTCEVQQKCPRNMRADMSAGVKAS